MPYLKTYTIREIRTRLETILVHQESKVIKHEAERIMGLLPIPKSDQRGRYRR